MLFYLYEPAILACQNTFRFSWTVGEADASHQRDEAFCDFWQEVEEEVVL